MSLSMVYLQVDGTGNCLFSAVKKSLSVRTSTSQEATSFPNRYFCHWCASMVSRLRGRQIGAGGGLHHCPLNNNYACCSRGISGVMRWYCMPSHVCGLWRSPSWTWKPCKNTGFIMTGQWTQLTSWSHTMPWITSMLRISSGVWLNAQLNDQQLLHCKYERQSEWPTC